MSTLKRIHYFIYLVILMSLSGCSSTPDPLFQITLETDHTFPPGLNTLITHVWTIPNVPTLYQSYLSGARSEDDIGRINPISGNMEAQFTSIDWAIIEEVSIHMISSLDPSISKEIFFRNQILQSELNDLVLINSLSEVKDILLQDFVHLEIRLKLRSITPTQIDTRITMNFNVYGPEQ